MVGRDNIACMVGKGAWSLIVLRGLESHNPSMEVESPKLHNEVAEHSQYKNMSNGSLQSRSS